MLELRPVCENCNKKLPPDSLEAMICSFECTFCSTCAKEVLENVCPKCGGGFWQRPIRPAINWRNGNFLGEYPASGTIKHKPVDKNVHEKFSASIKTIDPAKR
jgi:uncharacterized protein